MTGKIVIVLGVILLVWGLAACGTIEVGLADDESQKSSLIDEIGDDNESTTIPSPAATATEITTTEPTITPLPAVVTVAATAAPTAAAQNAPADWQRFTDDEFGIELWHPPGTTVVIGEPARPEFSSAEYPEGIVEEQLFVARVMQDEGGSFGPPGPLAILEVKLVRNPEAENVALLADLYSKRCPGPLRSLPQPTTVNVQLSGYRYGCEGIDAILFNEFWSPQPNDPQLLFGAAWADMSAPLSEEILATIAFIG